MTRLPLAAALIATLSGQAVNPQATTEQVCTRGWAATQRPPLAYTAPIKRAMLPPGTRMQDMILDHITPIELGGAPRDPANLQLQTPAKAHAKDLEENRLHALVCSGRMTLRQAQGVWKRD